VENEIIKQKKSECEVEEKNSERGTRAGQTICAAIEREWAFIKNGQRFAVGMVSRVGERWRKNNRRGIGQRKDGRARGTGPKVG